MRVPLFLFRLGLLYTVQSSPVVPGAVKSKAGWPFVALLLALGALLLFLFFMKWVYIARRRKAHDQRPYLRSKWYDNLSAVSTSRLPNVINIPVDKKSGFFIGLLGSPSWETRYSAVISNLPDQCSLLHTNSLSSWKSEDLIASSSEKYKLSSPVLEKTTSGAGPVSTYRDLCLKLPPLAKVVNRSPLLSDNEYMQLSGRTSSPIPSNSKNAMTDARTPSATMTLSQSPSTSVNCTSLGNPCFSVPVKDPLFCDVLESPLTSVLSASPSLDQYRQGKEHESPVPSPKADGLAKEIKKASGKFLTMSPVCDLVLDLDGKLKITCDGLSSNVQPTSGAQSPPSERNPIKHAKTCMKPSGAGRKHFSPKLGPSPLRTMIHPPECNSCDTLFSNQHSASLPSTHKLSDKTNQLSCKRDQRSSNTRNSCWKKSADADSLLNLMAELVQETSAWDPSLFVDENFKALVSKADRQPILEQKPKAKRQSSRFSRSMRYRCTFTPLEDIPEVDGTFGMPCYRKIILIGLGPVTEMIPLHTTKGGFQPSFWSDEDDNFQL